MPATDAINSPQKGTEGEGVNLDGVHWEKTLSFPGALYLSNSPIFSNRWACDFEYSAMLFLNYIMKYGVPHFDL